MRAPERTRQEIDPVGTFAIRHITVGAAALAFLVPVVLVVVSIDRLVQPAAALLGLVAIGTATYIVVTATDPYRGPFYRVRQGWVLALCQVAAVLMAVASAGTLTALNVGWASPVALGFLLLAMSPYRPVHELLAHTVLGALMMGAILLVQYGSEPVGGVPMTALVALQVFPVLTLGFSAARYTDSMIIAAEGWRRDASRAVDQMTEQQHDGIARSVQQDRVTILSREVVPFFEYTLEQPRLTPQVRRRAAEIADSIRRVMVAEVDRTWLEMLVDHLHTRTRRAGDPHSPPPTVMDADTVANLMDYDQRTALRALLVAIYDLAADRPEELEIVIARDGDRCRGLIAVRLEVSDFTVRNRFGPYLTVMRVVFRRLRAEYVQNVLTVRFVYDQR